MNCFTDKEVCLYNWSMRVTRSYLNPMLILQSING